uniref:OBG-type G domain-containing protein n=1 Tax=Glycine max TaxID=3847 RepID=A0A0R0LKC4_SOYBN
MLVFQAKCIKHMEAFTQRFISRWSVTLYARYSDTPQKKSKLAPLQERRMMDQCKIFAKAGDGGNGCSSLRKGRPYGGNGGRGGDIILECSHRVWDFSGLQRHLLIGSRDADKIRQPVDSDHPWDIPGALVDDFPNPGNGSTSGVTSGEVKAMHSTGCSSSQDEETDVKKSEKSRQVALTNVFSQLSTSNGAPEFGTEDIGGKQEILYNVAELTEEGQQIVIARGGEDSRKPVTMALSCQHMDNVQDPDSVLSSQQAGSPGSETVLILELKRVLLMAKPAVGDYAFTTLRPNLGNLNYDDLSITVADIPGLIKGAHQNRGLGHAFLRHIERTKVLAYVVDLAATLNGRKGIPPWEQLRDLILELEYHQDGLSKRPSLIVANKTDEEGAEEVYKELKRRVQGVPIFPVCFSLYLSFVVHKETVKPVVFQSNKGS